MIFKKYPKIIWAVSKISDGNMSFLKGNPKEVLENRKTFLSSLGINLNSLIAMELQHGVDIEKVGKKDLERGIFH